MQSSGNVEFSTRIGPGFVTSPTFEAMRFPAGEAHVKVVNDNAGKGSLTEVCRIYGADGNDLLTAAMWADACRRRGSRTVLLLPYLPGARADHSEFIPFGAGVYADLINSIRADRVVCFDPHSDVMPSLIHNILVVDSTRLVRKQIVGRADVDRGPQRFAGIIAPDDGAVDRARKVAGACHLPLFRAHKHRDADSGRLSGFSCEPLPATGRLLVVDDICDGGGTFMGLAEETGLPRERLGLYVSHGVFSGRAGDLTRYYGEIWTTDSYSKVSRIGDAADLLRLSSTLNGHLN